MKSTIQNILTYLDNAALQIEAAEMVIGIGCINLRLCTDDGQPLRLLIDRYNVIAAMMDHNIITGHDAGTNRVSTGSNGWTYLHHVYDELNLAERDELVYLAIRIHLEQALHVLDHPDPEELWPYFKEYTTAQKAALIWRLWEKNHVELYEPRIVSEHIRTILDTGGRLPANCNMEHHLFANWVVRTPNNLLAITPRPQPHDNGLYVTTVA